MSTQRTLLGSLAGAGLVVPRRRAIGSAEADVPLDPATVVWLVVAVVVLVDHRRKEAAATCVAGRRPPVEADAIREMQIVDLGAKARERRRRVRGLDGRVRSTAGLLRPLRPLDAATQQQDLARRVVVEHRGQVRLLEQVVGAVLVAGVVAETVEPDLRRFTPAAEHRERRAPMEQPRRDELRFEPLVVLEGPAAADVDVVVGTDERRPAEAEREAAACIRVLEERMPVRRAAGEHGVEPLEDLLHPVRHVGLQPGGLLGLCLLDQRLPRRRLLILGRDRGRHLGRQRDPGKGLKR